MKKVTRDTGIKIQDPPADVMRLEPGGAGAVSQKDHGMVLCVHFGPKQTEHMKDLLKVGLYGLSLHEVVVRAVDRFILDETQEN